MTDFPEIKWVVLLGVIGYIAMQLTGAPAP